MSEERKVGENFNADKAADIFKKLKNVEGKVKPKKDDSQFKRITDLMSEAKYLEGKGKLEEAVDLYKQVVFILPDSSKAYGAIADIYKKQGNTDGEKEILKKAIANCSKNEEFEKRLNEIE